MVEFTKYELSGDDYTGDLCAYILLHEFGARLIMSNRIQRNEGRRRLLLLLLLLLLLMS